MKDHVVGIGMAALDFLGVVERLPGPDSSVDMSQFSIQGGGNTASALVTASTLGLKTTFFGKIADDMFGALIKESFEQAQVNLTGLHVEPECISPFSYVAVEAGGGRRVLFHTRGNCAPLRGDEIDLDLVENASALLLDGHQMEASIRAAEHATRKGVPVFLDASTVSEGMGELLSLADVLVAAERFAAEVAPMGELEDALLELQKMGPATVVLTLGREGSIGLQENKVVRIAPHPVQIVDTTGAGDVYRGAFVFGWLQRWPLEKTMQFSSVAAALKCRHLGGQAGIPHRAEIEEHAF
jgi:sugar/nucleoside kinase (ribokinase family)